MSYCRWCDNFFEPTSGKQIYCSPECRMLSVKDKNLERYHIEKRKKRIGKEKECAGGCGTILSIYNDTGMCTNCLINKKKFDHFIKDLKDYFDYES